MIGYTGSSTTYFTPVTLTPTPTCVYVGARLGAPPPAWVRGQGPDSGGWVPLAALLQLVLQVSPLPAAVHRLGGVVQGVPVVVHRVPGVVLTPDNPVGVAVHTQLGYICPYS